MTSIASSALSFQTSSHAAPKSLGASFSAGICFLLCSSVSVVLVHRDDDIPLFVSCVDIPVRLGNLFQRIASINNRLKMSRFHQLFEKQQPFSTYLWTAIIDGEVCPVRSEGLLCTAILMASSLPCQRHQR